jgi:hypothetical protein
MPFGSGCWIEVFMIVFCVLFGANPWLALALMRCLNFLFGKAFRFSRRDNK